MLAAGPAVWPAGHASARAGHASGDAQAALTSAAFFAFHLLLAYLVDHVDVHLAQLVFLVLFSYAFVFEGYTGLTVTVGAVLTLFVLMQLTGRVDWNEVFGERRPGGELPR